MATASASEAGGFLQQLQVLGWIDTTAIAVLAVFFVIGLFKGLFWQVSRIAILLVAYGVAGRFGGDVGQWLSRDLPAGSDPVAAQPDTTLYLAYVFVFLAVLVLLSLVAMQVQKLVKKTGLGFFDRIGGGLFGVATGACTVLFLLFLVNMFFHNTSLATDAQASHSQRFSRQALDWLGPRVPNELRGALDLTPLGPDGESEPADPGQANPTGRRDH